MPNPNRLDLDPAVRSGIITADQAERLVHFFGEPTTILIERPRFTFVHVLYYLVCAVFLVHLRPITLSRHFHLVILILPPLSRRRPPSARYLARDVRCPARLRKDNSNFAPHYAFR